MVRSCVKCGATIPEGRYTCPKCKAKQPSMSAENYGKQLTYPGMNAEKRMPKIDLNGSEESLRLGIEHSIRALEMQESGTAWGKLSVILTGDSGDYMNVKLLKALIDQNKIIIRQNELLLHLIY